MFATLTRAAGVFFLHALLKKDMCLQCFVFFGEILSFSNPYISIVVKSLLVVLVYGWASIYWNISQEATDLWSKVKTLLIATFSK